MTFYYFAVPALADTDLTLTNKAWQVNLQVCFSVWVQKKSSVSYQQGDYVVSDLLIPTMLTDHRLQQPGTDNNIQIEF